MVISTSHTWNYKHFARFLPSLHTSSKLKYIFLLSYTHTVPTGIVFVYTYICTHTHVDLFVGNNRREIFRSINDIWYKNGFTEKTKRLLTLPLEQFFPNCSTNIIFIYTCRFSISPPLAHVANHTPPRRFSFHIYTRNILYSKRRSCN